MFCAKKLGLHPVDGHVGNKHDNVHVLESYVGNWSPCKIPLMLSPNRKIYTHLEKMDGRQLLNLPLGQSSP